MAGFFVLALARLVMEAGLPVRLRVMIPAVENAIAGNAYRPGDVIATRLENGRALVILVLNIESIPAAFALIFKQAFAPDALVGGGGAAAGAAGVARSVIRGRADRDHGLVGRALPTHPAHRGHAHRGRRPARQRL